MGLRRIFRNLKSANKIKDKYLNTSYSQEGEDMVLNRMLGEKPNGFFVDVGALHPQRFSNTYNFYLLGWRGINIDAMPGSMDLFDKIRPHDTNLEFPISDTSGILEYYIFNDPALNTCSALTAKEHSKAEGYFVERTIKIKTRTLEAILDEYLPKGQSIDFLTIDVEGLDFQVLKSNNWLKYLPKIILIESFLSLPEMMDSDQNRFLCERGYSISCKTVNTYFYQLQN